MSTDIVFDKQSVRLTKDIYMPVVLAGSNNCFDWNDRIARSWCTLFHSENGEPWGTLNQMGSYCDKLNRKKAEEYDDYSPNKFGWFSSMRMSNGSMSFGQFKGLFVRSAQKAITVSALIKIFGSSIVVEMCRYGCKEKGVEQQIRHPKSGRELMRHYQELKVISGDEKIPVHVKVQWDEGLAKRVRAKFFPIKKKRSESVYMTSYYSVVVPEGYFSRLTRYGYRFSHSYPQLRYASYQEANKKVRYLRRKRGYEFRVKHVEEPGWVNVAA